MFFNLNTGKQKMPDQQDSNNWYQNTALGKFAQQNQDTANQWFDNTAFGKNIGALQDYGKRLQKDAGDWFLQNTWPGQAVNDYRQGIDKSFQSGLDQTRQQYMTELNKIYDSTLKKMGLI